MRRYAGCFLICSGHIAKSRQKYVPDMRTTICLQLAVFVITSVTSIHLKHQIKLADEGGKVPEDVEGFRYVP
jgi:hypothetical protein